MESAPETRVLMLTVSDEEDAIVEAVAAGAAGYLQKATGTERLLSALQDVLKGEIRLPVGVVRRTFTALHASAGGDAALAGGADAERAGDTRLLPPLECPIAQIVEARCVKSVTIRNSIYGIQEKLGIDSMQELVLWSARNGLLDDDTT